MASAKATDFQYCSRCLQFVAALSDVVGIRFATVATQREQDLPISDLSVGWSLDEFRRAARRCQLCRLLLKALQQNHGFKGFNEANRHDSEMTSDVSRQYDVNGISDNDGEAINRVLVHTLLDLESDDLFVQFDVSVASSYREKCKISIPERLPLFISGSKCACCQIFLARAIHLEFDRPRVIRRL